MEKLVELCFSLPPLSKTDVTGKLPKNCRFPIPYAKAELYHLPEGRLLVQHYKNYLFYLEWYEFNLHSELQASYRIKEPCLFLFFVLDGSISFYTPYGESIYDAAKGMYYATSNNTGEYLFRLPPGVHQLFYIVPKTDYLVKYPEDYPDLQALLENMEQDKNQYSHMPSVPIEGGLFLSMLDLYKLNTAKIDDLEVEISKKCRALLKAYNKLVKLKLAQPVYLIMDYLEKNYADSGLTNQTLAGKFDLSEKTLIEHFRAEFNITPHAHLISVRMHKARELLNEQKLRVNRVYILVGYNDLRSFGSQFSKFFGHPPSDSY